MIPENKDRILTTRGASGQGAFTISEEGIAHIMGILRDGIYTDRVLAVLREYGANAWDAHRMSNQAGRPIEVHVPMHTQPELKIRDHGPGLSEEQMFANFAAYGASTKRDSNSAVGMLGIGSKAGFAYSDSFVVTSWHGGQRVVYVAAIDESDQGKLSIMHRSACSPDETGIEISIAVKPRDVEEFRSKAMELFRWYNPQPQINMTLPNPKHSWDECPYGFLESSGMGGSIWVAIMGCVPYRINLDQVRSKIAQQLFYGYAGVVRFDIGEVDISASREELKYSERTKKVLAERINQMVDHYVELCIKKVQAQDQTPWERRILVRSLGEILSFSKSQEIKEFSTSYVRLWTKNEDAPKTFYLRKGKDSSVTGVDVHKNTRLVVRDTRKPLSGYDGDFDRWNDTVVMPIAGFKLEAIREELETFIQVNQLTGIPVVDISTFPWVQRKVAQKNTKYAGRRFTFLGTYKTSRPSDNWEVREEEPDEDDVFVVISKFDGEKYKFLQEYERLKRHLTNLGQEKLLPEVIVGYKTTEKQPVDETELEGTEFQVAAEQIRKSANEAVKGQVEDALWAERFIDMPSYWTNRSSVAEQHKKHREKLALLPAGHPLRLYLEARVEAWYRHSKNDEDRRSALSSLISTEQIARRADAEEALCVAYPMFRLSHAGPQELLFSSTELWIQYVLTVDLARSATQAEEKKKEQEEE